VLCLSPGRCNVADKSQLYKETDDDPSVVGSEPSFLLWPNVEIEHVGSERLEEDRVANTLRRCALVNARA